MGRRVDGTDSSCRPKWRWSVLKKWLGSGSSPSQIYKGFPCGWACRETRILKCCNFTGQLSAASGRQLCLLNHLCFKLWSRLKGASGSLDVHVKVSGEGKRERRGISEQRVTFVIVTKIFGVFTSYWLLCGADPLPCAGLLRRCPGWDNRDVLRLCTEEW